MKKFALAVLIAVIAAAPAAALTKKKVKREASAAPAATASQSGTQNTTNFVKDGLPIFLPSWSMPAYMAVSGRKKLARVQAAAEPRQLCLPDRARRPVGRRLLARALQWITAPPRSWPSMLRLAPEAATMSA